MAATLKNKTFTGTTYEKFEAKLPLQTIDIREYEGRIKKYVYDKETVSIEQLQYAFCKDYADFDDLNDQNSTFYKVINSDVFKTSPMDPEMHIQYLLLFGLLYCKGSIKDKTEVFYDILQDGLQPNISANDKDLRDCFQRLLYLASSDIHKWVADFTEYDGVSSGLVPDFDRSNNNKKQWKEVTTNIEEKFLDDVFDVASKIDRKTFLKLVEKK